jgi:AcrR family transcriptional regulator
MPKGIPLTQEEQARRRREIFDAAVNTILQKGFQETSMREIADAAGMGKSSLYDYFKTKDEILIFIFVEQLNDITQKAIDLAAEGGSGEEKLRRIMHMHMDFLTDNKNLFTRLSAETQRLKLESQARIQSGRYAYQDLLRGILEEGIRTSEFRSINSLLAARSLITLLATAIYTSRPTGTSAQMVDEMLDLFMGGVRA